MTDELRSRKKGCQFCKHKLITEGFVECRAVWEHPFEEVMEHFKKAKRHFNGYDFALEYGKFRQECPYFEERKWWQL